MRITKFMKTFKLAVLASALVASGSLMAAPTQGTLGATSSGTSDVTIIKENAVQITGVADLDLGTHATLAADVSVNDDVCVFNSTATYSITVSSANGGFNLSDGTNNIPYSVDWSSGGAAVALTDGALLGSLTGDRTSLNCGGSTNANFSATVAAADFNAAGPGTYTDTLTLLVKPE